MKKKISGLILALLIIIQFQGFASGSSEEGGEGSALANGVELFNKGDLSAAAKQFKQAAASENREESAAGYYNHGTVSAMLAQDAEQDETRELLETACESLERAAAIGALPETQMKQAQKNLELSRKQLRLLPEQQENKAQDGNEGEKQDGQDGQSQQNEQSGQDSGSAQSGEDGSQSPSPEDLLAKQKQLTGETERGEGSTQDLADEQKNLQKASQEMANDSPQTSDSLNEAAINQSRAAEALEQGDRSKAAEYQKMAEAALSEAKGTEDSDAEAESILDTEAEYEAQNNRLDKIGGIQDAKRNW
jgi:hypothetical protein